MKMIRSPCCPVDGDGGLAQIYSIVDGITTHMLDRTYQSLGYCTKLTWPLHKGQVPPKPRLLLTSEVSLSSAPLSLLRGP